MWFLSCLGRERVEVIFRGKVDNGVKIEGMNENGFVVPWWTVAVAVIILAYIIVGILGYPESTRVAAWFMAGALFVVSLVVLLIQFFATA